MKKFKNRNRFKQKGLKRFFCYITKMLQYYKNITFVKKC